MMDVLKKGDEPNHQRLTLQEKLCLAQYRALDDLEREIVNLLVRAFKEGNQGHESINVQTLLCGFQECQFVAA